MKHSIKTQFALIFIGLMTGTILLCWFVNNTFLEKVYLQNKEHVLLNAYRNIDTSLTQNEIESDDFNLVFDQICSRNSLDVLILDTETQELKSSMHDSKLLNERLLDYLLGGNTVARVLKQGDNYILQTTQDPRMNTEYIELWGTLENGNLIIMRSAMDSIQDSADISNRFLACIGLAAIILSAFVISYVSGKVTKPIWELVSISERMTHLDFDAKYKIAGKNEIALLGDHMNQLSTTLEETISELKTANNELQSDLQKKTEIDEMRKEFLSNVSHELKTPIALIQGYAEGLKESIHDDEESKDFYCDVIMDEANKMNTLVKNLLELNQIESGNDSIVMERFDVTELIKNCIQSVDILLKQDDIRVVFDEDQPVYVWSDEFKTEQVFRNYLSNAIHYAAGQKLIEVKIERNGGTVRITVFNTGDPIAEDAIPQLWTKFYKVDKARTREYGGSGIGLSIVKAVMDSINQKYGVQNYDNGVAFWFELDGK
ncbi:MAG: HAMP domain-containing sensor histidine kinase [bacterium]|nr:HAMP domain-containing sensor histidine kinase [bacterium]